MKKNIIITIVIIIVIAIIAAAFYWFYLKPQTQIEEEILPEGGGILPTMSGLPSPSAPSESGLSASEGGGEQPILRSLVNKDVLAFWPSATSSLQYLTQEGLFEINYLESPVKEQKKDLGVNFSNVLSVEPSVKGKVLIKYVATGATKPAYSILDIKTGEIKNLDTYIKSATWSPDGETLLYYYSDSPLYYQENFKESSYLAQLDKNLANRKILLNFKAASDINLLWPAANTAYILQKPSGLAETTILAFDVKNKIFTPFVSGNGLIIKWDNQGKYGLLFSVEPNTQKPKLELINSDEVILAEIPNVTLPEKCVFANNRPIVYCSIFVNPTFTGIWPDTYYIGTASFDELIYEINLETMEAKLLNDTLFKIDDIRISADDQYLFFFDNKTKTLYSLSLPKEKEVTPSISPTVTPITSPHTTSPASSGLPEKSTATTTP
ncbi:MAG TPA: hypothetical protein PLX48_00715 [Candidatus Paceibacterota bacterium]|nr:hypothetical protein [Candidatus Paceibacterota bacterium]